MSPQQQRVTTLVNGLLFFGWGYIIKSEPQLFTWMLGVAALATLGTSAVLDSWALIRGTDTIGDGIRRSGRRFGLYRALISIALGAVLAHLFWPSPA